MLHPEAAAASSTSLEARNDLEKALYACDQEPASQVVAYVSKMFAVARGDLPQFRRKELSAEEMRAKGREEREKRAAVAANAEEAPSENGKPLEEDISKPLESLSLEDPQPPIPERNGSTQEPESSEVLLGFSRIFSGVLRRNTSMIATLPKYDAALGVSHPKNARYKTTVHVKDLYMMMGRELVAVEEVPAGHVCAIGGLDGKVFRNATLWAPNAEGSSEDAKAGALINLAGISMQVSPKIGVKLIIVCSDCTSRLGA